METERINKNKDLLNIAKTLRRNMTRHEKHLWYDYLQHYPVKIYKQRIINNYIADFYCHKARLVIELDGSQHYTEKGRADDSERTRIFEGYGLYVLRFTNREVDNNFEGVCLRIDKVIKESIAE